jgi:hypothetical protein
VKCEYRVTETNREESDEYELCHVMCHSCSVCRAPTMSSRVAAKLSMFGVLLLF